MQSSIGSYGAGYGSQQSGHLQDSQVNINDDVKAAGPVGMGSGTAVGVTAGMPAAAGVGLGITLSPMNAPSEVSSFMNMYLHIFTFVFLEERTPSKFVIISL